VLKNGKGGLGEPQGKKKTGLSRKNRVFSSSEKKQAGRRKKPERRESQLPYKKKYDRLKEGFTERGRGKKVGRPQSHSPKHLKEKREPARPRQIDGPPNKEGNERNTHKENASVGEVLVLLDTIVERP